MLKISKSKKLIISLLFSSSVFAQETANNSNETGLYQSIKQSLSATWNSDTYELFVPVNTWHNRYTYDRDKIDSYNERPWGIGAGVSRVDSDGDWHAIYTMVFKDSHNKFQPIIGYGYQTYWHPTNDKFALGIGYTLGVTARDDMHWIPIPVPLPILSINYDRLAIQSTYIPGSHNNGNVLFTWLTWRL